MYVLSSSHKTTEKKEDEETRLFCPKSLEKRPDPAGSNSWAIGSRMPTRIKENLVVGCMLGGTQGRTQ